MDDMFFIHLLITSFSLYCSPMVYIIEPVPNKDIIQVEIILINDGGYITIIYNGITMDNAKHNNEGVTTSFIYLFIGN